ncbi:MAG: hippurate hydrolase [Flammeovirgaceae bacterium]|jgi:amidohydrolase
MKSILLSFLFIAIQLASFAQSKQDLTKQVDSDYAYLDKLYKNLHTNPELSFHEEETGKKMAANLKELGFEVTTNFGGFGVVGVLKNGEGKTVWVRTDTDALPLKEDTGLPYASKVETKNDDGQTVSVMHACGHDVHMTVWTGVARLLAKMKKEWKGTIVMLAQPAEERGSGARMMLAEGLFEKFPKPDYCLSLHTNATLEAGTVGVCSGYALASVDMVDITVYGQGGHGAYPHTTIDPVVLASRMVLDFQTIVSREISPTEPAVVTVGSIHGGTKHNIISSEVKMQLTLRSYSDAVRQHTIEALKRISRGIAISAGLPEDKMPKMVIQNESIPSTYNTPSLVEKSRISFEKVIGAENVIPVTAVMGGEDFGMYGKTEDKFPIFIYWLGTVSPEKIKASKESGKGLPSLHSPFFAPLPEPTIKTGILTMSQAVLDLLKEK